MNDSELLIPSCRYCLSEENFLDMVSPCCCKNSLKYVHKQCLIKWFEQTNNRVVLPGRFSQYDFVCEICHTPYKVKYTQTYNNKKLWLDILKYLVLVSTCLILSYLAVGWFCQQFTFTRNLFFTLDTEIQNIFANGFIYVHILLGIFYTFVSLSQNNCFCFAIYEPIGGAVSEAAELLICMFIFMGVICTVLIVYVDVIQHVLQRHYNRTKHIIDIESYTSV